MTSTEKQLAQLGLSKHEAKVYLALLGLGECGAGLIAQQAGLKRPTTYLALEDLQKKGLIIESIKNKQKVFVTENPDKLWRLARKMRRKVVAAELQLEQAMPGLQALRKKLLKAPKVTFYEGRNGYRQVLEDLTSSRQPWYFFGSVDRFVKSLSKKELDELVAETEVLREKSGRPKAHMITDKKIFSMGRFRIKRPGVREIKILPQAGKRSTGFCVYGDKVAVFSVEQVPFGTIIESEEIAELVRGMFKVIWDSLK